MLELDTENPEVDQGDLEDVTDLVFSALDHLKDCELLAKPDFDLFETMSSFEVMDPKMDMRMARKEALHPKQAIAKGILITDRELSPAELQALLQEFFIQIATWQDQTA